MVSFTDCALLLNFLSLQPEQYAKISARNILPYLDVPRYIFTSGVQLNPNAVGTYTFTNIQLNQIPDLFIIVARKPMSQQDWRDSSSFLCIKNISINFNLVSCHLLLSRNYISYRKRTDRLSVITSLLDMLMPMSTTTKTVMEMQRSLAKALIFHPLDRC